MSNERFIVRLDGSIEVASLADARDVQEAFAKFRAEDRLADTVGLALKKGKMPKKRPGSVLPASLFW